MVAALTVAEGHRAVLLATERTAVLLLSAQRVRSLESAVELASQTQLSVPQLVLGQELERDLRGIPVARRAGRDVAPLP